MIRITVAKKDAGMCLGDFALGLARQAGMESFTVWVDGTKQLAATATSTILEEGQVVEVMDERERMDMVRSWIRSPGKEHMIAEKECK